MDMDVEDGRDINTGHFLPGNRFWEVRSSAGRKPKFTDPEKLWEACVEYFEWVHTNPLWEDRLVTFQGRASHEPVAKMRAMTISGLCLFLDISRNTWNDWRTDRADLEDIIERAEAVIYSQKFAGAAADLLNANIISRELGLAEKTELGGSLGLTDDRTPEEVEGAIASKLAGLAARGGPSGLPQEPGA